MIDDNALAEAMGDLDEDVMVETLNEVMADGGSGAQDAMAACQKGMDIVGSRFEEGEYFVGDLIYAGELMTQAVGILKDALVSGVLTLALNSMKATIEALKAAGLTDVKVIIGGAPVSAEACVSVGADEWAHSPQKRVSTCKAWTEQQAS